MLVKWLKPMAFAKRQIPILVHQRNFSEQNEGGGFKIRAPGNLSKFLPSKQQP